MPHSPDLFVFYKLKITFQNNKKNSWDFLKNLLGSGAFSEPHTPAVWPTPNPYSADICLHKPWMRKGFFQSKIIVNVSVSSIRFIWILMSWVYGYYTYFNSFSAGTVSIHHNLTCTDVTCARIKTVSALKGLIIPYLRHSRTFNHFFNPLSAETMDTKEFYSI